MTSRTAPKTILLMGDPIAKEAVANAAITPGHLVERMSTGKLRKHATAGAKCAPMFAREEEYTGGNIDTAYAGDDQVPFYFCRAGDEIYALVAAGAAAIAIGDRLESAGDGTLRKVAGLTDNSGGSGNTTLQDIGGTPAEAEIANNFADVAAFLNLTQPSAIAVAVEAVDNSGGGSAVRIRVEIL